MNKVPEIKKMPDFISINSFDKKEYLKTKNVIDKYNLVTVCEEANCPNRYECFSKKTATFMILGDICTRNCLYCNIKKGIPKKVDKSEPKNIAKTINKLGLKYAVITCVTRDDLNDYGSEQFIKTLKEIKKTNPECKTELLISDLGGNFNLLENIISNKPCVLNHNIEVVREIFNELRPKGNYQLSLDLLKKAKEINPKLITKSGFMVGLGENKKQIIKTINDLKNQGCDIVTIGQYLAPSEKHYPVKKYYAKKEFEELEKIAKKIGIKQVFAGALVRSSYHAKDLTRRIKNE